ncbi:MAG: catalase, partial [Polaromonas sp.]
DAIKFPDLIHTLKPESHHELPQASSAHDSFWDFASFAPEVAHMLDVRKVLDRQVPQAFQSAITLHRYRDRMNLDTVPA